MAIAAGVFFASDLTLYHHGVEFVGAGLGTVIPNLQVVIVAIAGWLLLGEHPDRRTWLAMPVAVLGVLLISGLLEHGAYGADPPLGVAFGLGAGASYAGYLLIIRQGNRDGRRPFGTLFDASAATVVGRRWPASSSATWTSFRAGRHTAGSSRSRSSHRSPGTASSTYRCRACRPC